MTKIISCAQLDMRDRRSLPPKPRIGDGVERLDMSMLLGTVVKIKRPNKVVVAWGGKSYTDELITDLALVSRN